MPSLHPLLSQCDPAGRRPVKTGDQQIIIVARSAQQPPHCTGGGIRSDKGWNARSDRAQTANILRDRSVTAFVRSRRRCPADTFGATFWCQKVVNLLLAENAESKVRDTSRSKNRFLLCFWIKPKYQKINRGENICFFMIPDKNRIENRRFSF